jgi:hypothetical protein
MMDTLTLFKKLTEAGMPPGQADVIVQELFEIKQAAERSHPQATPTVPTRYSKNAFWNWYMENSSRHPFLNGIGTGITLVAIEWAVVFPIIDGFLKFLRAH